MFGFATQSMSSSKKKKTPQTESQETGKYVQTPLDGQVTEIPNAVIVIKVNWLQLAG